jgi:hypothetical protein
MDVSQSNQFARDSKPTNWDRRDIAAKLVMANLLADSGRSQQDCARQCDVPRSTLQNWIRNRSELELRVPGATSEVQFFRITPRARVPT